MILRMWRGRTRAEVADEYVEYMKRTGIQGYRDTDGNRGCRILRRIDDGEAEFLVVSEWESLDAIRRFAGDTYEKARYYPDDERYLLEREPLVRHYEVVLEG